MKYSTTAAYVSGGICGHLWMPNALAGKTIKKNLRGPWGIMDRFTEPVDFRTALNSLLNEEGGDFRNPMFTEDTVIRIERRSKSENGRYNVHVWERNISSIKNCNDLVDSDCYVADFLSEDY